MYFFFQKIKRTYLRTEIAKICANYHLCKPVLANLGKCSFLVAGFYWITSKVTLIKILNGKSVACKIVQKLHVQRT